MLGIDRLLGKRRQEPNLGIHGNSGTIQWLRNMLKIAIKKKVSDVHFEPSGEEMIVRFRMNGVLQKVERIEKPYSKNLVRCIKVLSNMDITSYQTFQEGRLKLRLEEAETDFRIAIAPTPHGESVVIRILDNRILSSTIDDCLNKKENKQLFESIERCRNGLILVCGPTGSGKTSFLYGLLCYLCRADLKIITVEDPVEYTINGIVQVQLDVKRKFGFPEALKYILRHDPDVIMVGEIRDAQAAKIAIQAALTGHLVLATLHASDSVMAIGRLADLGIESYFIATACRYIIAQRLFPILCPLCFQSKNIETKNSNNNREICSQCNGLGYEGRTAIREILHVDNKISDLIYEEASMMQLNKEAVKQGMITLKDQARALFNQKIIDAKTYQMLGLE